MPLPDITILNEDDTFQTLFTRNNQIITRLNILDVSGITTSNGIYATTPDSVGGITLSAIIEKTEFVITSASPPSIGTIGYFTGITFETTNIINGNVALKETPLLFVTENVSGGFKVASSGKVNSTSYAVNTVYYLGNTSGILDATPPNSVGKLIKPVIFGMGITYGAILLNQPGTIIQDSNSYSKSSSRSIAEIPSTGLTLGHVVFYDTETPGWTQSNASDFKTAEVFGIVESIVGSTAYAVTRGSVNVPNVVLHLMGGSPEGGEGGEDIWFLSGTTAGHMQNLAPSTEEYIVKPLYYKAPHSFSGVTYSGIFVNYLGYRVLGGNDADAGDPRFSMDPNDITSIGHTTTSIGIDGTTVNGYINSTLTHTSLLGQTIGRIGDNRSMAVANAVVLKIDPDNFGAVRDVIGYANGFTTTITSTIALATGARIKCGWGTDLVCGEVLDGANSIVLFYKNSGVEPGQTSIKFNRESTNFTANIGDEDVVISVIAPNLGRTPYYRMRVKPGTLIPSNILDQNIQFLVNQVSSLNLNVNKILTETKITKI